MGPGSIHMEALVLQLLGVIQSRTACLVEKMGSGCSALKMQMPLCDLGRQRERKRGQGQRRLNWKTQLSCNSETLDSPLPLLSFLVAKAYSLPQKLRSDRVWEGDRDPGEDGITTGNHRPGVSFFHIQPVKGRVSATPQQTQH